MKSTAFQRMRLQSHAYIKRQIAEYEQRLNLVSKRTNRQATCRFNAHSAFLLCAVNPSGPCSLCQDYAPVN
ncbi:hypothetical protein IQ249_10655 [Lusitaniella coriacea LEGE 07157]|uniref:Uncharacterized protein n=1 Tax=Lusitaniella coriacea LEGE 07157 TaxID=945747 RepID=A0A8J7DX79_9CYAN|nr:DUF6464 family protein [Lusitaniella coriacea]MBE9116358.1 hypothetical protein [Lusitaniella coriacea LEGE 07157]